MPVQIQGRPRAGMAFSGRRIAAGPAPRSAAGAYLEAVPDSLSFGGFDQVKALGGALFDAYNGQSAIDAYRRRIQAEHELDRADAEQHPVARNWGKGTGAAMQLLTSGPLGLAVRGGARIAEVTPLALRELGVLGSVGAAGGVATRAGVDRLNHRRSSWADLGAAGFGGALDTLLSRSGNPARAGAIGGAATSMAGDVLNGRAPSPWEMLYAASGGGFIGARAGRIGREFADGLPSKAAQGSLSKEQLGEYASLVRTLARGDRTATRVKSRTYLPGGGYTYPDQRTLAGNLVESKFGRSAKLSRRQRQAYRELGPAYRVDHMLPEDVGSVLAYPTVQIDYQMRDVRDRMNRPAR